MECMGFVGSDSSKSYLHNSVPVVLSRQTAILGPKSIAVVIKTFPSPVATGLSGTDSIKTGDQVASEKLSGFNQTGTPVQALWIRLSDVGKARQAHEGADLLNQSSEGAPRPIYQRTGDPHIERALGGRKTGSRR